MSKHGQLPPFEPTPEQRELVEILSAGGIPQTAIRRFIKSPDTGESIGVSTLQRHFRKELDSGIQVANGKLVEKAYRMAISGNVSLLIFLLKVRMGWKEPATEVNLHQTYGELVSSAVEKGKEEAAKKAALTLMQGGRAA